MWQQSNNHLYRCQEDVVHKEANLLFSPPLKKIYFYIWFIYTEPFIDNCSEVQYMEDGSPVEQRAKTEEIFD